MITMMPRSTFCFHNSLLMKWIPTSVMGHHRKLVLPSAKCYFSSHTLKAPNLFPTCDNRLRTIAVLNRIIGNSCNTFQDDMDYLSKKYVHTSSSYRKADFKANLQRREKIMEKSALQSFKEKVGPYFKLMRYDKLTGTYLLYLPCTWSILLAYDPNITSLYETSKMLCLFLTGAYIMRSAGCIINDMMDKDIDSKVSRTKDRPLANERLTNMQALVLLAAHLSAGLAILLQLNWLSVFIGAPSVILVAIYPLAKRYTHLAQVVLGSVFSWGAILGNTAICGTLVPGTILPLYFAALCWIVHYDTIYAHQDRSEDVHLGLKSTAILLSGKTPLSTPQGRIRLRTALSCLSALTLSGCSLSILHATDGTVPATTIMMLLSPAAAHFVWQIFSLNEDSSEDCASKFKSNVHAGILILAAIISAKIMQSKMEGRHHQMNSNVLAIEN